MTWCLLLLLVLVLQHADDNVEYWYSSSEEDIEQDIEEPPRNDYQQTAAASEEERNGFILARWIVSFIYHMRRVCALSDVAAGILLKFFVAIFTVLGKLYQPFSIILQYIPTSLYTMKSSYSVIKEFRRYVVCRKCDSVYSLAECKDRDKSKRCPFVLFPNHPHARMRTPCNSLLLKTVELFSGKKLLYPHVTYCYMSIQNSLQSLLLQPTFFNECEKWRSRTLPENTLQDIYDGNIWKEFQNYNGTPFLSQPYCFGFTINLDWFRPFKHSQYSVGAIYMTIMNLPRNLRNKPENVLLVGILPGPSEPANISGFLTPLVNELNEFWNGKQLEVYGSVTKKL